MDLSTTARVKSYLGIPSSKTESDALIAQLVTRASGQVTKFCTRSFGRQVTTGARFDGTGNDRQMLPNTPIISVESLSVDGVAIAASADAIAAGYQFDDTMLYLFGYVFTRGRRNVLVSYTAGFSSSEADLIPATSPYTITPSTSDANGNDGASLAVTDRGVVFTTTGVALALVAGTPTTGQYNFAGGIYTFAAADKGLSVTMSYDYVPAAVEQACIEMVALKLRQRDNIGVQSRVLAGETVTYTDRDMTAAVKGLLGPYNRRAPV